MMWPADLARFPGDDDYFDYVGGGDGGDGAGIDDGGGDGDDGCYDDVIADDEGDDGGGDNDHDCD
eukprot:5649628-Pyramimonas_sp.AAC.1